MSTATESALRRVGSFSLEAELSPDILMSPVLQKEIEGVAVTFSSVAVLSSGISLFVKCSVISTNQRKLLCLFSYL